MTTKLLRYAQELSLRGVVNAVPKKRTRVALTLHNVSSKHYAWVDQTIAHIKEKYGFLDPGNVILDDTHNQRFPRVLLTFDDGFASSRYLAEEVLEPLGIRGLFFVTYDFIGLAKNEAYSFAQKYFYPAREISTADGRIEALDWQDIHWLLSKGHVIGAHTFTHNALASLPVARQREEIIFAADCLQQRLGNPIRQFAYPFGSVSSVDSHSIDCARERFDLAYSNVRGMLDESPSEHFLFRQNLVPGAPIWMVDAIIEGRLDWRYRGVRDEAYLRFSERGGSR